MANKRAVNASRGHVINHIARVNRAPGDDADLIAPARAPLFCQHATDEVVHGSGILRIARVV